MVRNVHRNHKAREDTASEVRNPVRKVNTDGAERPQKPQGLLGTGRTAREKGAWRWGKREIIYLSLHCHHQNGFCIKTGSDKSHFNVSLIVRDKDSQGNIHKPQLFQRKRRAEAESSRGPSVYQPYR